MKKLLAMATMLVGLAGPAFAEYPNQPIKLLVPFPAGGATDVIARFVAEKLGPALGGTVVVLNVAGAGGSLAAVQAAKADPDGYTLFFGTTGTLSINQSLYKSLSYDPIKDFRSISLVGTSANLLLVSPSVPATNLKELIAYGKANPGKLSYGSAGKGSSTHLAGALMESVAGVELLHVPYRGGAAAMTDLIGGRISMAFDTIPTGLNFAASSNLRAFASTGIERSAATKDIPTFSEAGVPGYDVLIWFSLNGPTKMSPELVAKLNAAAAKAMSDPDLRSRLLGMGVDPRSSTPEELSKLISDDAEKWKKVIGEAKISIE